jgi:hypothetical protein
MKLTVFEISVLEIFPRDQYTKNTRVIKSIFSDLPKVKIQLRDVKQENALSNAT